MPDVANIDLCKELFELSGWRPGTGRSYGREDDGSYTLDKSPAQHSNPPEAEPSFVPAYSLGYLLRKLPAEATSKRHGGYHYLYLHHGKQDWYAYYGEIDTTEFMASGDTPEDAACKLLIMLIKQGVLHGGN